jgi:hypothetical protein
VPQSNLPLASVGMGHVGTPDARQAQQHGVGEHHDRVAGGKHARGGQAELPCQEPMENVSTNNADRPGREHRQAEAQAGPQVLCEQVVSAGEVGPLEPQRRGSGHQTGGAQGQ